MIGIKHSGSFKNTLAFLNKASKPNYLSILSRYGEIGKNALAAATPLDSGETALSWDYQVTQTKTGYEVSWHNTNMAGNVPVAVLLQYGHATKDGAFIAGIDFINPALEPVFEQLAEAAWKEVNSL